ncbi:hypothetical protein KJ765_03300 [Candidatus Micrarchaeota archaeon]|nr:hypothetical protein [Candidatus Micrarchaeota archaeon]
MKIAARIRKAWRKLRKEKPQNGILFEKEKGRVELEVANDFKIRLDLFKEFKGRNRWGFELTAMNKSDIKYAEIVVAFNRKKGVQIKELPPESMRVKSVEFTKDELSINNVLVEVYRLSGNEKQKKSFVVPMHEYFETLRGTKYLTVVEGAGNDSEIERQKQAWRTANAATLKGLSLPRVHTETTLDLQARIQELEEQKQNLTKQFMKREISYNEYAEVLNSISRELNASKTKLDHMKKDLE